jgi:hypothetical protein
MTMPETNTDIDVEYDTDTGLSWSRSICVEDDVKQALQDAKPVTTADLSVDGSEIRLGADRYWEGSNDWWPEELDERQIREGLPPDYEVFSVIEEWDHEFRYKCYIFVTLKPCRAYHYSPGEIVG